MTEGMQRRARPDLGATEEVSEADAAEQQTDVLDPTDAADLGETETLASRAARDRWDIAGEAVNPDDDRVVSLDDDEYR